MSSLLLPLFLLFQGIKSETVNCHDLTGICTCDASGSGICTLKCSNADSCEGMEFICAAGRACTIECGQDSCHNALFDGKEATTVTVQCQSTACNGDAADGSDMRLLCGSNTCSLTCNEYGCQHLTAIYYNKQFFSCLPGAPSAYCTSVQRMTYSETIDPTVSPSEQPTPYPSYYTTDPPSTDEITDDTIWFEPWYDSNHVWYPSFIFHGIFDQPECPDLIPEKVEMYQRSTQEWIENGQYYEELEGHRYAWNNSSPFNLSLDIRITKSNGEVIAFYNVIRSYDADAIWNTDTQWCPIPSPTDVPTYDPSINPMDDPTVDPTMVPSSPTTSPSEATSDATSVPSDNPTSLPSNNSSAFPTQLPSIVATANPSASSSNDPTESPAKKETETPLTSPSAEPSGTPTPEPSTDAPTENEQEGVVHPEAIIPKEFGIEFEISMQLNTTNKTTTAEIKSYLATIVSTLITDKIDNEACYDERQNDIEVTLHQNEAIISTKMYVCDRNTEAQLIASLGNDYFGMQLVQTINDDDNGIKVVDEISMTYNQLSSEQTITEGAENSNDVILWAIIAICVVFVIVCCILGYIYYLRKYHKSQQEIPIPKYRMRVSTKSKISMDNVDFCVDGYDHIETTKGGFGAESVDAIHDGRDREDSIELEAMYDNKETKGLCDEGSVGAREQQPSVIGHFRDTRQSVQKVRKETDYI